MKTLKLIIAAVLLAFTCTTQAQVAVSLTVGTPPAWAPAEASGVRYYYLPDIQVYYDANTSNYIYYSGGIWRHTAYLPSSYGHYDLYGGYKVMLNDYHGERPYDHFRDHRRSYPKGYNHGHFQKTYGERPGKGNSDDRHDNHQDNGHGHEGHGDNNGHDHGNDREHDHGNDKGHGNNGNGHKDDNNHSNK
jgi:hypothetical protein